MTASPIPLRPATEAPALTTLQPPGWKKPKGYANGMAGRGTVVMTGGLIGWDENEVLAEGFLPQVEQILRNILAVLAEAGAGRSTSRGSPGTCAASTPIAPACPSSGRSTAG